MARSREAGATETDSELRAGLMRRDSDWGGHPRTHEEALEWAAKRAAVTMAAATIHACDGGTGAHSDDVVHLCDAIADELGVYGNDRAELLLAAQLHDVGKVTVPHEVLNRPGPLNDRDWALIREHTVAGERIVQSVPELGEVARLVRHSHERWDGGGYPDGLCGESIPLGSRIVFCADAFHAIRSDRPYRRGRSARAALEEVQRGAGSQFDPEVANALVKSAEQLRSRFRAGGKALNTRRSRRLATLLLTLAVSGSALAAGGFHLRGDAGHAGARKSLPASISAPAAGGEASASKPEFPANIHRASRSDARSAGTAGHTGRRDAQAGSYEPTGRSATTTPATVAFESPPSLPRRRRVGPSPRPGRSGESPRRLGTVGQPRRPDPKQIRAGLVKPAQAGQPALYVVQMPVHSR